MYGYKEYVPLNIDEIFKRISQEEIFGIVIKEPIIVDREFTYVAPYRNDSNADCYFEYFEDNLCFVDFADVDKRPKRCFEIVSRTYNISFLEALQYVNQYFELGLGNSQTPIKPVIQTNIIPKKITNIVKTQEDILYLVRDFNHADRIYWSKYGITKQHLIDDKVYPIVLYKSINNKGLPFSIRSIYPMYAYTDFEESRCKIYIPRENKLKKWHTNCTQNDIGSIFHLPSKGELLIITKSYKDCRVIRNQNLNSVWLQSEGVLPNVAIIKQFCENFTKIIVFFDNDEPGIIAGKSVVNYINSVTPQKAKLVTLPLQLLEENIKDPSDLVAKKGEEELVKFLKSIVSE